MIEIPVEIGPNQAQIDRMKQRFQKVNDISPTMCLAKWLQVSLHLQTGAGHSCHHPEIHKIPLEEIKDNPSALHNTLFKKERRKEMLEGKRPDECQYCWNIEDLEGDYISDRCYKSADTEWSMNHYGDVVRAGAEGDINPSYLEVSFSNACNFKCIYCSSEYSSQWANEALKFGAYPTSHKNHDPDHLKKRDQWPYHPKAHNPYVEAFHEWFPEIYQTLNVLRITGGEPLLHDDTWKIIDYIEKNPRPHLTFSINTNMGVPDKYIDQLIDAYKRLKGKVKSFVVFTSCDSAWDQAEYIRDGLDYNKFYSNVMKYLTETGKESQVNFMITFSMLSMTPFFIDFLDQIHLLRSVYNQTDSMNRVPFMISYVRWPTFLSPQVAPRPQKKWFVDTVIPWMEEINDKVEPSKLLIREGKVIRPETGRFYLEEIDQIKRLGEFLMEEDKEFERNREDFWAYIEEYDKRRGKNFEEVFPELVEAFCQEALDE